MKKSFPVTLVLLLLLSIAVPAQAWWIFGDSGASNAILQNVTINSVPFEGSPRQLVFYPEFLPGGQITINGKALVNGRPAQALHVTTNAQETWQSMPLSADGTFVYSFRPTPGAEYGIYLKAEADGKTNDVQRSGKLVRISNQPLHAAAAEALNNLLAAYKQEDARLFMSYVSPSFAGDDILLARAIRRDFTALDNIDVRYTIGSVAIDPKGKVSVTLRYSRTAVLARLLHIKNNPVIHDSGTTQMVFALGEHGLKLYSMKMPLLFGLSDAVNVSSGAVRSSDNSRVLGITPRGEGFIGNLQDINNNEAPDYYYDPGHGGGTDPGGGTSPDPGGI